jgi:hypothetical protein
MPTGTAAAFMIRPTTTPSANDLGAPSVARRPSPTCALFNADKTHGLDQLIQNVGNNHA